MMKTDEIVNAVYCTYDYGKFKRLANNRTVGSTRVEKLKASLSIKQIPSPIVVNEKMQIIDGQGRFEAEKSLGLPIYYIICKGTGIDECRQMNQYNTKWNELDFIKSYADAGNVNYVRFKKLIDELSMPAGRALRYANKDSQNKSNGKKNVVADGNLHWTDDDSDMVRKVYSYALELKKALEFTPRLSETFWKCVKIISDFDGYDQKRMIAKCRVRRFHFTQMSNMKDLLTEFSEIYNYRSKSEIHFETYMHNKGKNVQSYVNNGTKLAADISTLEK